MTSTPNNWKSGVFFGSLGMLGFSGTLVATRVAVADFSPLSITSGRIVFAAVLALITLQLAGMLKLPERRHLPSLIWMGAGLAIGYPLFLAIALESVPAAHGAVVTGLAPAATAVIAVLRNGERMSRGFWLATAVGFLGVLYFAIDAGGGHFSVENIWLFLAMMSLGVAYVEGARASQALGAIAALSWSMILLLPGAAAVFAYSLWDQDITAIPQLSWWGFCYLGAISMFLASVFWYRGLAEGGTARIGQINLLLPITALVWAALLLEEEISATAAVCAVIVSAAMVACVRSRVSKLAQKPRSP